MDKEVKARLRAVVHLEGISNKEIAKKIGYSDEMVSKSLSLKHDVLTQKFLNNFFEAYPEVASKHKSHILNGENNLFGGDIEVLRTENEALKQKLNLLERTIEKMESEKKWLQSIIEKALQLHPDLVKLLSPFALQNELGVNSSLHGVLIHEGANKGATRIAAA